MSRPSRCNSPALASPTTVRWGVRSVFQSLLTSAGCATAPAATASEPASETASAAVVARRITPRPGRLHRNTSSVSPSPIGRRTLSGGEARVLQQADPRRPREQAGLVPIVEHAHLAALAHQQRVIGPRLAVARHRIPRPLDVAQRSLAVVAFEQLGALDERVRDVVGREDRRAARPRVDERRLDRRAQVGLRRHVGDAVVGEDGVEDAAEPQRPHVAGDVLALGIAGAAERQHRLGDVGERAGETAP